MLLSLILLSARAGLAATIASPIESVMARPAVKTGIIVQDGDTVVQSAKQVNTVVFNKMGTLT